MSNETLSTTLSINQVLRNRNGSVLGRRSILKADHFDQTFNSHLDFYIQGAPNFRSTASNIVGVGQPTASGISTVLSVLGCCPSTGDKECVWFSAREEPILYINGAPFVLRDAEDPLCNIKTYQGINSQRLDQMEDRLLKDVLSESAKFNGLLLVHDETADTQAKKILVPTWTAITHLQTPRQVFQALQDSGYKVNFIRIPISPDQASDYYLDTYINTIKTTPPQSTLVFNCGMGVGRTTFAMVVALLIRQSQTNKHLEKKDDAVLRLMSLLSNALPAPAIPWLLSRQHLLSDLLVSLDGNYQSILQLISVLPSGAKAKCFLDDCIDKCSRMINLRERILEYRVAGKLGKAMGALERYFFLVALSGYLMCEEEQGFGEWLSGREEIYRMLETLRNKGPRLELFRPVEDLSGSSDKNRMDGEKVVSELEREAIKLRKGTVLVPYTILKIDFWLKDLVKIDTIDGASNFRKIPNLPIYAVAQPTYSGILNLLPTLPTKILWINLREEPLVYISGTPYVLRDLSNTLRNIKSYSGITAQRLEMIEDRLVQDVQNEMTADDGKILVHRELDGGGVSGVWESGQVRSCREVFKGIEGIEYFRVPVTAEKAPDESDFDHLLGILVNGVGVDVGIVVNCQVGSGRSTTGTVIASLVLKWIYGTKESSPSTTRITMSNRSTDTHPTLKRTLSSISGTLCSPPSFPKLNYPIINALLRVILSGLECKRIVDECIDACAQIVNLRDCIEHARLSAEESKKPGDNGIMHLKRYFMLIAFQAYLTEVSPNSVDVGGGFKGYMTRHPELQRMLVEMEEMGGEAIVPVERMAPGDGVALTTEVLDVVNQRAGAVLACQTILKYDMFPGAQKGSLVEKIDGAPNYRGILISEIKKSVLFSTIQTDVKSPSIYGIGMPTKEAIRSVLKKVGASSDGKSRKLLWTSLREEPVLYVKGRPYVLRLFQNPLKNLEATGIATERVEMMEARMKLDVLNELKKYHGRVLLHDEEGDINSFSVIPVWETVKEEDVQTPLEVYNSIKDEGYNVDYLRIPITDEQAPIPGVFDALVERLHGLDSETDVIFNCQLGRGRTTTGMVSACLMEMIVGNKDITKFEYTKRTPEKLDVDDDVHDSQYLVGEYRIILQLISVLQYGKLSKTLTDMAIDTCEHMQNLRVAVYDYKLRFEAAQVGTKKHEMLFDVGMNYLVRYFYLITFADYLVQETTGLMTRSTCGVGDVMVNTVPGIKFSEWLAERREISNILRKMNQALE